jgi:two-component sensor histidine kinase
MTVTDLKLEISRILLRAFVLGALGLLTVREGWGGPTTIQPYIDGAAGHPNDGVLTIPSSSRQIVFEVGDANGSGHPREGRVRYKLEGVDDAWRQKDGLVCFYVYFYGRNGDLVDRKIYEMNGKSPGWNGAMENSTFTHRRENLTVPPGADTIRLAFSSAGPPTTVGIYVVENVLITRQVGATGVPDIVLDGMSFLRSGSRGDPKAVRWFPDGTRLSMAKLLQLPGSDSSTKAFGIIDDDTSSHAEWRTGKEDAPKVYPGEALTVSWNEMYDTSMADQGYFTYGPLVAGHYRFVVQAVDAMDRPLSTENSISVVVSPPYWKNPWFWFGGAAAFVILLVLGGKYWMSVNIRRHLQRTRLVEEERLRIARDLHDELGARLAHIALTSANAESEESIPDAHRSFQKISRMTRELAAALSEVVWVVNPENDHLESLISFLHRLIHNVCEPTGIRCRIDALALAGPRPVPGALRHHVGLAVKEAINNVLKHSRATEIQANIRFEDPILKICIADNGKGFNPEQAGHGNGLANMRNRMLALHGKMTVKSAEGEGTTISFEVPIP